MSLAIVKCKERVIEAPIEKRAKVTFFKGAKNVLKNKYFWIINIASWIGFLECAYGIILGWSFIYSHGGEKAAAMSRRQSATRFCTALRKSREKEDRDFLKITSQKSEFRNFRKMKSENKR